MTGGGNLVRNERYRKTPRTPRSAHARYYYSRPLVLGSPERRRPNTPRSRCQSAPKVMDSHSRSASPRDPARPQHRPPSPPSSPQSGFDNRAYQHDESDPNHNDSFTSNGPHQNGHSKEPNGDTKTLEAVNLELINLTPKNGAKKKDVEVDMNATNPYDEYFVPVNEHRKYMRGEKLYVTADKRGEKGGCKRPLCWTLLGLVVAAIVALIVLAATGILFTNSPTPLEQYNASVSSARAFGGITNEHNHEHDHSGHHHDHNEHDHHHHDQDQTTLSPQHGTETQSDEAHDTSMTSEESGDTSMYVPRTLEGTLKIDNEIFTPDFEDPESEQYRDFATSFSDALKHALFDRNTLENGDNEIMVEVVQIRNGSLMVTYRIHWIPKHTAAPTEDILSAKTLTTNLNNYLNNNSRMISIYHVAEEELTTSRVHDLCKINNNDCEYKCEFDDTSLDFMCVCPHGQIADIRAPKKCTSLLDNSESRQNNLEPTSQTETKVLTFNSDETTMKTVPEEQPVQLPNEENEYDWKEPRHYSPETTTEAEPDQNFSHIFGPETPKPEPEPSAEPGFSIPAPTLTQKPEDEPDFVTEPQPEPATGILPEPSAEPNPEPGSVPEPESVPESEPTTGSNFEPEPIAEPEPATEPKPEPEPATEPRPEPEPTAEPNSEKEPIAMPNFDVQPSAEPTSNSESNTQTEGHHQQEPVPVVEPQLEMKTTTELIHSLNPTTEFKYERNPAFESKEEHEPSRELQTEDITNGSQPKENTVLMDEQVTKTDEFMQSNTTFKPKPSFDHPTFDLDSLIGVHTTAEPEIQLTGMEITTENDLLLTSNKDHLNENINNNFETKLLEHKENTSNDMDKVMTTTMRISLSEPNIINDPSYEPKPEIISILRENGPLLNSTNFDTTTIENDWLQAEDDNNSLEQQTTSTNINDQTEMHNEINSENVNKTEQRSSKKIDEFGLESTTNDNNERNSEDITFDLIKKNEELAPIVTTVAPAVEKMTDISEMITNIYIYYNETTTLPNKISDHKEEEGNDFPVVNNTDTVSENNELKSRPQENENAATTEYSINKQLIDTHEDKNLMEALGVNSSSNVVANYSSTERGLPDDSTDVTFDAINMLYNRSSKSIEKENEKPQIMDSNEIGKEESSETTTDSDWLTESVTEVNYEDVMNKMEKQETTETSATKIDDIMGRGNSKDDFEPDYLSNMGSNASKMSDQDEPLYGMTQDYDNEDSRIKRVNMDKTKSDLDSEENKTELSNKEMSVSTNLTSNTPETTTISQYIYKVSEQNLDGGSEKSTTSKPAPVWEDSDTKDLTVKEISKQNMNEESQPINGLSITSTAFPVTTMSVNDIYSDNRTGNSEVMAQNTTQVNNLNVTIYEISSHKENQSFISPKPTNAPLAEFIDHETEMNPFLPEVENNKSLVKKLQEGHDIEPTSLNETQNENIDEHAPSNTDTSNFESNQSIQETAENNDANIPNNSFMATTPASPETTTTAIIDDDFLFNHLLTNSNSREDESEYTTEVTKVLTSSPSSNVDQKITIESEKNDDKEVLPISTFLLDTDDLDTTKKPSTLTKNDFQPSPFNGQMTSNPVNENDSEYLSVVPIEQDTKQQLKKNFNSESIQELNYISDSPKKSDRRTIDESSLDSVINNVA